MFIGKLESVKNFFYQRVAPVSYARSIGVTVGRSCRLLGVTFGTEPYLVTLGDHVSATATKFETHDGGVWVFRDEYPEIDIVKPVIVGDNVYFGHGCIVLPGVTIGSNVVVGAGSIVTRDVPSGTVVAGVPARQIESLEAYREKCLRKSDPTKLLAPNAKKKYYTKKYGM